LNFFVLELVLDLLYLLLAFSMSLNHYSAVERSVTYQRYRIQFGRPLTDTASNTGVWLTLTFTVERYIAVCHPMKGKVRLAIPSYRQSHNLGPDVVLIQTQVRT